MLNRSKQVWSEICKMASSEDTPNNIHSQDSLVNNFFAWVSSHTTKIRLPRPVSYFLKKRHNMPYSLNISTPVFLFWLQAICVVCPVPPLWDHNSGSTRTNCLLQKSASVLEAMSYSERTSDFPKEGNNSSFPVLLLLPTSNDADLSTSTSSAFPPLSSLSPMLSSGEMEVKNAGFANKNAIF